MDPDSSIDKLRLTMMLVYALPFVLFVVAGFVGAWIERRHFQSIRERESATHHLPAVPLRTPEPDRTVASATLVSASIVVSHDYFKRALAQLRKIFGGRLRSYESLLDRARREAVLRLKEQCPDAHVVLCLRIETSRVTNVHSRAGTGAIEVLAYGTAVRYAQ